MEHFIDPSFRNMAHFFSARVSHLNYRVTHGNLEIFADVPIKNHHIYLLYSIFSLAYVASWPQFDLRIRHLKCLEDYVVVRDVFISG